MSVEIRFEPDGPSGLVAEGTSIMDAARRLGFQIPDCGECDAACAVKIITGATLLSALTDTERKQLSPERLAGGERLACQCRIERGGELVLRLAAQTGRPRTAKEKTRDLKKEFRELSLQGKLSTLVQLETIAATEAFDAVTESTVSFAKKVFDSFLPAGEAKQDQGASKANKTT